MLIPPIDTWQRKMEMYISSKIQNCDVFEWCLRLNFIFLLSVAASPSEVTQERFLLWIYNKQKKKLSQIQIELILKFCKNVFLWVR